MTTQVKASRDVSSKYNLLWQLTRVKNKKEKFLKNKLDNIVSFLYSYPSIDNKNRILNYLNGLELGYKDFLSRDIVRRCYIQISEFKPTKKDIDISIKDINTVDLLFLYNDLYKRNEQWLKNNYRHEEQNKFLEKLYKELKKRNIKVNKNFDIIPTGKMRHRFIY